MLTDDQCDEFRRLPCSFNDMVRAIYESGYDAGKKVILNGGIRTYAYEAFGQYQTNPYCKPNSTLILDNYE